MYSELSSGMEGSDSLTSSRRMQLSQNFDDTARKISKRALQYETQLKELNTKLSENLSNFRAIDSLLQEALDGLQRNTKRADRALNLHVPRIEDELDESLVSLHELATALPTIQSQVSTIRYVYDSGRRKAKDLVKDLEWLNTDFHERWRTIIFTSSSPVSWRWKTTMRFLFALSFIMFVCVAWVALGGAYRAHRQRLVWGERLMS